MLMLKSAKRAPGGEQPYWTPMPFAKNFKMRLPIIHYEWEIPETIQAMVVFVTGVAATAYLQDIFDLPWETAISIVIVHEILYCLHQLFGDVLIGGWITPSIPITTVFLLTYEGTDRIAALCSLQFLLLIIFFLLGITRSAKRIVDFTPDCLKAGILIGAGISAVIGRYGFATAASGGLGFNYMPISFSVGVLTAYFLLYSRGFQQIKDIKKAEGKAGIFTLLEKSGFVPALICGYIAGLIAGELPAPTFNLADGFLFNPVPNLIWAFNNFSIMGNGFPSMGILISAIPMAIICYIIAFGDIVIGETLLQQASQIRTDEKIDIDTNKTHILCGIRNGIESCFSPTVTTSGPLWVGMTVTVVERYRGSDSMYSIIGGAGTFNIMKAVSCFIIPMLALIRPILPLAMSLTLMIQAYACFYIGYGLLKTNQERGAAGMIGAILAIAGPAIGLACGIVITIVVIYLLYSKKKEIELAEITVNNTGKKENE